MSLIALCIHKNKTVKSVYIPNEDISMDEVNYFINQPVKKDQAYRYKNFIVYLNSNCLLITDENYSCSSAKSLLNEMNLNSSLTLIYDKYKNKNISDIDEKLNNVKIIMIENIDLALQNTVKLDSLEKRTEELVVLSGDFRRNAKSLKNKMYWNSIKIKVMIGSAVLIVL